MRHGFTLIELMIVIAIIAIIAAIAIPNLLESRITANEAQAAASLKSGIFAGEVQFQSGSYSDMDSDGRGEYATDHQYLAGATASSTNVGTTTIPVTLIAPTYKVAEGTAVGAYKYQIDTVPNANAASADLAESYWAGFAAPNTASDGRRSFGINVAGVVYATKQGHTGYASLTTISGNSTAANASIFATDPTQNNASNNVASAAPFQK